MNTFATTSANKTVEHAATASAWGRIVSYAEENRFGIICFALLVVGCLGGVTMAFGAFQSVPLMIVVLLPTMTTLSLLLSVSPMRWVLPGIIASTIIDILVCIALIV